MHAQEQANEHLRVIRSLMERATIYRAISAPTALVGGILALATAFLLPETDARSFIAGWLLVLLATLTANTWFIWQKARREGGKIFSSGLRLAIRSALPAFLVTAALTASFWRDDGNEGTSLLAAAVWTLFYGLGLLSTTTFAPRSLIHLGWIFLATGIGAQPIASGNLRWPVNHPAALLMGLTFGVYHLIYAACTWPRKGLARSAQIAIE